MNTADQAGDTGPGAGVLAVVNRDPSFSDAELAHAVDVADAYINRVLFPTWGSFATVGPFAPTDTRPPGCCVIDLLPHEDLVGAAGDHRFVNRRGYGVVGIAEARGVVGGVPRTLCHEIGEMKVDPTGGALVLIGRRLYPYEIHDAVDGNQLGEVPSLVLPSYFVPGSDGPWDLNGELAGPLTPDTDPPVVPGGYMSFFDLEHPELGWQTFLGAGVPTAKAARAIARWSPAGRHGARLAPRISSLLQGLRWIAGGGD